jgi:hypothetical protein
VSLPAIIANAVSVLEVAGFREADNRRPIEDQAEGAVDGRFQVGVTPTVDVTPWLGIPQTRRSASLTVRFGYFRGGGTAGGGDRLSVCARANTDCLRAAAFLTNPERYAAETTRTNRITSPNWRRVVDGERVEFWDLTLAVEFEAELDERAVA